MAIVVTRQLDMLNALMIFKDGQWKIDTVGDDFTSPRGNFARFDDCLNALVSAEVTAEQAAPFRAFLRMLFANTAQITTIQWVSATGSTPGDEESTPEISLEIVTSDGLPTEEDIELSITYGGDAIPGGRAGEDYTPIPLDPIPAGTESGSQVAITPFTVVGSNNPDAVVELTIDESEAYEIGDKATHSHTLSYVEPDFAPEGYELRGTFRFANNYTAGNTSGDLTEQSSQVILNDYGYNPDTEEYIRFTFVAGNTTSFSRAQLGSVAADIESTTVWNSYTEIQAPN